MVTTSNEKIKIPGKLRGGMCAVAVGLTLRWYFTLKYNFPLIFYSNAYFSDDTLIRHNLFTNKYHYSIFLFTLTFHSRVPVSPLNKYTTKFVQRGFTERATFEGRIPRVERGFTVKYNGDIIIIIDLELWCNCWGGADLIIYFQST
jgi:hypothetical protein